MKNIMIFLASFASLIATAEGAICPTAILACKLERIDSEGTMIVESSRETSFQFLNDQPSYKSSPSCEAELVIPTAGGYSYKVQVQGDMHSTVFLMDPSGMAVAPHFELDASIGKFFSLINKNEHFSCILN